MKTLLFAATAAVTLSATAFAAETPPHKITVKAGGTLPATSNGEGVPQSVNSLPPGFMDGSPGMLRRQELHRHWAQGATSAKQR
ncbi:MAG: hypothetical protein JO212_00125 [Acetobacteraceae bacterium]|nr:hypothetical protein [Acetobacteraceae bacterium]